MSIILAMLGIYILVRFVVGIRPQLKKRLTVRFLAPLGLFAGFYRGWLDQVVSRIVDIWMAFPPVLFSILLVAVLGTGLHSVIIAIVAIDWIRFARPGAAARGA